MLHTFNLVDSLGDVELLLALLLLVVLHQHLDQLIVHDLHVHLVVQEGRHELLLVPGHDPGGILHLVQTSDVISMLARPGTMMVSMVSLTTGIIVMVT